MTVNPPVLSPQVIPVPFCRHAANPACAPLVLPAALTTRIAFARVEIQETWDACLYAIAVTADQSAMLSAGVSAVSFINDVERRALADLRSYYSVDLTSRRQSLLCYLTQHTSEAIQSIQEALHARILVAVNPPGVVVIQPNDGSTVNESILLLSFHVR